jgi:hypothetical protein
MTRIYARSAFAFLAITTAVALAPTATADDGSILDITCDTSSEVFDACMDDFTDACFQAGGNATIGNTETGEAGCFSVPEDPQSGDSSDLQPARDLSLTDPSDNSTGRDRGTKATNQSPSDRLPKPRQQERGPAASAPNAEDPAPQ